MRSVLFAALFLVSACSLIPDRGAPIAASDQAWRTIAPENLLLLSTQTGTTVIELRPDLAPRHVEEVRRAARAGVYDGEYFYRVVDGHVAQFGREFDARLTDWPDLPFEATQTRDGNGFRPLGNGDLYAGQVGWRDGQAVARKAGKEWPLHCPGAVGMARDEPVTSGKVELYIPLAPRRYLDQNYTVLGRVVHGMDAVHRLKRVDPTSAEDTPAFFSDDAAKVAAAFSARAARLSDNRIASARIAADIPPKTRPVFEVMNINHPDFTAELTRQRDRTGISAFPVDPPKVIDICSVTIPVRKKADTP